MPALFAIVRQDASLGAGFERVRVTRRDRSEALRLCGKMQARGMRVRVVRLIVPVGVGEVCRTAHLGSEVAR